MAQPRESDRMLVLKNYDNNMNRFTKGLQNPQWEDHTTLESITDKESTVILKALREQLRTRSG